MYFYLSSSPAFSTAPTLAEPCSPGAACPQPTLLTPAVAAWPRAGCYESAMQWVQEGRGCPTKGHSDSQHNTAGCLQLSICGRCQLPITNISSPPHPQLHISARSCRPWFSSSSCSHSMFCICKLPHSFNHRLIFNQTASPNQDTVLWPFHKRADAVTMRAQPSGNGATAATTETVLSLHSVTLHRLRHRQMAIIGQRAKRQNCSIYLFSSNSFHAQRAYAKLNQSEV